MTKPKITQLFELCHRIVCLYEGFETVNPHNVMTEQIDLSGYFYRTHQEDVFRLYHLLVHCLTCLQHLYRVKLDNGRYESTREDNVIALQLLSTEGFDHRLLPASCWDTYRELMAYYGTANTFVRTDATAVLVLNVHTFKWQLKRLKEQGYVVQVGKNRHNAFVYRLIDKLNPFELKNTLMEENTDENQEISYRTSFEEGLPEVKPKWLL